MSAQESDASQFQQRFEYFNPYAFEKKYISAARFIENNLPPGFVPRGVITLGSAGLGSVADEIEKVCDPIPYGSIPHFPKTTVVGHEGKVIPGYLEGFPVLGLKGRKHYYELGGEPNQVIALKEVTFPVYVARALGAEFYIATNAAGGLNPDYDPGDLMVIRAHNSLHFPNVLAGKEVKFPGLNLPRFQPQNGQYSEKFRRLFHQAARNTGESAHVKEGVYVAVTGPTFETAPDSKTLRVEGADATGMSTVPEVIVASNLGMETGGFSLISNKINLDGTNPTSHEEVMAALGNPATMRRARNVTKEFFRLLGKEYQYHLFLH